MSNHYHIVVRLRSDESRSWTDHEVAQRWTALYKGPLLLQSWLRDGCVNPEQQNTLEEMISVLRHRLSDLSWFMKCLNEPIARMANKEDGCTGHFWEGRFKSQALRKEAELIACMAYVDLNPVRAGMASTPETSDHTSIKERLRPVFNGRKAITEPCQLDYLHHTEFDVKPLAALSQRNSNNNALPFAERDYIQLVDWTGRVIRGDKRGSINDSLPPILERIQLRPKDWLPEALAFEQRRRRRRRANHLALNKTA